MEIGNFLQYDTTGIITNSFDGFGTSLCWFANALGETDNRDYLADLLFNQTNEDSLQLNIVRYNIGGGSDSTENFREGGNIESYFDYPVDEWYKVDTSQRYFLKKSKEYGATIFEVFSNSPPRQMTISGKTAGNYNRFSSNLNNTPKQKLFGTPIIV